MNKMNLILFFTSAMLFCSRINFAFRVFDVNGVHTILASEDEPVSIVCSSGMPMAYCGFISPKGKRYSLSGPALSDGTCVLKISATKQEEGTWKCHIGKRSIGVEMKKEIKLRVVEKLTAIEQNISAIHGKDVTLSCVTTEERTPVKYCRFEPPNESPFSIDPGVKSSRPILGKYYFPLNKSLDRGDCAVTIHKVKYSDVGNWTCGAGLDDGKEHTDIITLEVEGFYAMSVASTTGITIGSIGIVIFLIILGLLVWKKRKFMGASERPQEAIEIQELPQAPVSVEQERSPELVRHIPLVVVQSPSDSGSPSQTQATIEIQEFSQAPVSVEQERSPELVRRIPLVVVQSPSDSGSPSQTQATIEIQELPQAPVSVEQERSPELVRHIPLVVVQSPSDSGSPSQTQATPAPP